MLRALHTKFAKSLACASIFASLFLIAETATAQFTVGRIVVERVGDGSAALSGNGAPIFLDEYTTSGTAGVSVMVPTVTGTVNRAVESGTAGSDGNMTRSANGRYLVLPGYDANPGTASVASAAIDRVITRTDGLQNMSSTVFTPAAGFLGNNFRGIASDDGSRYWMAGAVTGIIFIPHAGNTSASAVTTSTVVSTTVTNTRTTGVFNGQLYFGTGSGTTRGVYKVGSGLPTVSSTTSTSFVNAGGSASSYNFWFNAGGTICYVADASITGTGGIQKWTYSGSWSLAYLIQPDGTTQGCQGLAVDFSGTYPVIYATTTEASSNFLKKIVDGGSGTYTITTVATAGTNEVFRGVSFAPFTASITSAPPVCSGGHAVANFQGSPGATMTFSVNGTAASTSPYTFTTGSYSYDAGATSSSVTFTIGTVTGDNSISHVVNQSATVTINPAPATPTLSPPTAAVNTFATQALTFGGNPGDQITYTWTGGGPATTTIGAGGTSVVSVTPTSAGSYTYMVTMNTSSLSCTYSPPAGSIKSILTVTDVPFANFVGASQAVCQGATPAPVVIQGNGGGTVVYGDGVSSYTVTLSGSGGTGTQTITPSTSVAGVTTYTLTSVTPLGAGSPTTVSGSYAVTVNPTPSSINGTLAVCLGSSTTLTDGFAGTWSSSAGSGTVTIGSGSGSVTGASVGTANITFTSAAGCIITAVETVNALPSAGSISGASSVCLGSTISLSDATGSGTWSSTVSGNASVDGSGNVTGATAGTTIISYTVTDVNGCKSAATQSVTVNPAASAGTITGPTVVAGTSSITLSDAIAGGNWTSSNTSAATVAGATGVVTAVAPGTTTISYTISVCGTATATYNVTVKATYFTPGNLVVEQPQGNSSAAAPVLLIEYAPVASASIVSTLSIPSTVTGAQLTVSGTATAEGFMSLSAERDRLVLAGYDVSGGTLSVAGTSNPRNIATVDGYGNILFPYETTVFGANNMRGGTASGTNYFGTGKTVGVVYMNNSTTLESSSVNNRFMEIFNGNTYVSSGSSPYQGVNQMGSVGTSTVTGQSFTLLAADASANGPEAFAVSPDGHTMYVASGTSGTLKFTRAGTTGAFSLASGYTTSGVVNSIPVSGIAVDFSTPSSPKIYATTTSATNIIGFQDAGTTVTTVTTVATTTTSTPFRGLMFAPSCFASATATTASLCGSGNSSVVITGNPTGVVSYNVNGGSTQTITLDATGSNTVTLTGITITTTVNLLSISTTACSSAPLSGSAIVSVNPIPAPTVSPATAALGTGSAQVLTFTGNSGDVITYQWSSGGAPTSTTITIGAGGTATVSALPPSAGSYTYIPGNERNFSI